MKTYTCEQYYLGGLSFLLKEQIGNAVNCFLEGAGMQDERFTILCKAMLFYTTEISTEDKGPKAVGFHEAIKCFYSVHPETLEGNSFIPTLYFLGHTAEKIGMESESLTPLHPLYHYLYREITAICYQCIIENAPNMVDLFKSTNPINTRLENINKTQQLKAESLLNEEQRQEISLFMSGNLPADGIIGRLFNNDSEMIKKINTLQFFERLLYVCNTISAKVNDLKC